jgi:hypothetical protein
VRADLESVVSWWTRPERLAGQRARFERADVRDFEYQETLCEGELIIESSWTTAKGLQVSLRMAGPVIDPGTVADRNADSEVVLRHETSQSRRWPNGREDSSRSEVVVVFSEIAHNRTRVRMTATRHADGSWWDRFVLRINGRRLRRQTLNELIAGCERDLGAV